MAMPNELASRIENVVTHGYGFPEHRLSGQLRAQRLALKPGVEDFVDLQLELGFTSLEATLQFGDISLAKYFENQMYDLIAARERLSRFDCEGPLFIRDQNELDIFMMSSDSVIDQHDPVLNYDHVTQIDAHRRRNMTRKTHTRRSISRFDLDILTCRAKSDHDFATNSKPEPWTQFIVNHILQMHRKAITAELYYTEVR